MKVRDIFEEGKELSVFDKHRKAIAIKTLKMNDAGAMVTGGMSKSEAREFLKSLGYTEERIKNLEK